MAQVLSCQCATAMAQVQSQASLRKKKAAMAKGFLQLLQFFPVSIIPPTLRRRVSSIYHQRCISLTTDSLLKNSPPITCLLRRKVEELFAVEISTVKKLHIRKRACVTK